MVKTDKGHRRVVASPRPIGIAQEHEIKDLVEREYIVICCGGGGIPVVHDGQGWRGVEAVIDKDLASSRLAQDIEADVFVIATDVEAAAVDWGKPEQRFLRKVSVDELQRFVDEGHFAAGSMGPKVEAASAFAERTGGLAAIGALEDAEAVLAGAAGTQIRVEPAAKSETRGCTRVTS